MQVGELIRKLKAFDEEHTVLVKNGSLENELPIEDIEWDYKNCLIVVDGE